jgi:GH24 family phage-related lysozyme (muramidase)
MRLDAEGVNLIASFEGYVGRPYNDAVGYATVGYGHLIGYRHVTSADIAHFAGWTQVDYKRLLKTDCARFEAAVRQAIHVQLTQAHLTSAERRWCREYDRLKRSGTNLARRRALRVAMEEQRKRIWQAAKADGHGNVKSGMQLHHRQERYHSLLARTT